MLLPLYVVISLFCKVADYINKSEVLLQSSTYMVLTTDPTTKHKNKLISLLKSIKAEGGINESTYKRLYPTGTATPKYYGLPKVYKKDIPLRPIVSSIGPVTYETAKVLSRILKPPGGQMSTSCEDQPRLHTQLRRNKIKTRRMYDVFLM